MVALDRQLPGNGHGKEGPWFPNHGGIVAGKAGIYAVLLGLSLRMEPCIISNCIPLFYTPVYFVYPLHIPSRLLNLVFSKFSRQTRPLGLTSGENRLELALRGPLVFRTMPPGSSDYRTPLKYMTRNPNFLDRWLVCPRNSRLSNIGG